MLAFKQVSLSCHSKLDGLRYQKYIISQLLRPEVQNVFHWVKIKVLARSHSLYETLGKSPFFATCGFCRLPAFLGLWLRYYNHYPHFHFVFFQGCTLIFFFGVENLKSLLNLLQYYSVVFFFFFLALRHVGSWKMKSEPLDHQDSPWVYTLLSVSQKDNSDGI